MKVCVTAGASGLDAPMDPRFGRCPFFVVVDLDSMSENSITNSNVTASSGAGIQAAQEIAKQGVSALITGNIGPNAMQTLSAAKIDVYQHQGGGSVRDVVEKFQQGELMKISSASVPVHAGMGQGPMGGGRGRGGGGGRGAGAGRGGGQGMEVDPVLAEAEVRELEEEVKDDEGLRSHHGRGRHARGHLPALRPGSYLHHGRSG